MKREFDLTYLGDILDAIKWIESYLHGVDKEDFLENHMMQDAVMHQIEIIGEASNNVLNSRRNIPNFRGRSCGRFGTKLSTIIERST